MKDGFAATRHGRLHYLEAGSGRPVILLHSNGNSAYEYEELISLLAAHCRVIAWDQPGHGDSEPTGRHFTVEDFSDAVVALMDALGLPAASVMGSSIGGAIAADLGTRRGARIDKLFIVEAPVRTPQEWAKGWANTEKNYAFATQTAEQVAARMRRVDDKLLARWSIDRNKAGRWAMLDVMWALREYDVRAAMPKIGFIGRPGFRFTPTSASWLHAVERFARSIRSPTSRPLSTASSPKPHPIPNPSSRPPIPGASSPLSNAGSRR
jgi:pimeloyl-ACP methyl ester carboxylesterase